MIFTAAIFLSIPVRDAAQAIHYNLLYMLCLLAAVMVGRSNAFDFFSPHMGQRALINVIVLLIASPDVVVIRA